MSAAVGGRIAVLVFVTSILQVSIFSAFTIGGGAPDVLLVVLVSIALLRGATTGALTGFAAGLIVDVATLGTLGLTSLLLTLVGYWSGRYGETTGRNRPQAPLVAAVAATAFMILGGYGLHSMLGEPVSARVVATAALVMVLWSAVLAYPVFALVRRVVGSAERVERAREVELVV